MLPNHEAIPPETKVTLEQWRYLIAVVEAGSFNKAAEQLLKSQSTISYSLQKLQDQLGLELLTIKGRKAELTDAGKVLLRRSKYLLDEASAIERVASAIANGWESEIKITVDEIFPNEVLFGALTEFEPEANDSRIDLFHTILSGTHDSIINKEANIALTGLPLTGFFAEPVLNLNLILVAHPSHPLQLLNRDINEDDLRAHRQIVVRDSGVRRRLDAGWLEAEKRWTVSGFHESLQLLRRNFGFAWLPFHIIEEDLNSGGLKPLPHPAGGTRVINCHIVFPDKNIVGPATERFAGLIRKHSRIYMRRTGSLSEFQR